MEEPVELTLGLSSCPDPDLPVLNLSDPALASLYAYKSLDAVLITTVYPCLCIVGLVANLSFLFSVWRVQDMRTITNIYLVNLAVADIWFLMTGTSFGLWKFLTTPVTSDYSLTRGPLGCFALSHLNATPFFASTLLVTVVSLERYLAICHSVYHRRINSRRRTIKQMVCVWLVANVLSSGLCLSGAQYTETCVTWPAETEYLHYPSTIASCFAVDALGLHALAFAIYSVPYWIEFTIAAIVFYKIVKAMNKRKELVLPFRSQQDANDGVIRTRNRVALMLVITGVTSFSLVTPREVMTIYYYVIYFAGIQGPLTRDQTFKIFVSVNLMLYVNSLLNPFIYAFCNPRYRAAVAKAFLGKIPSGGNQSAKSISSQLEIKNN